MMDMHTIDPKVAFDHAVKVGAFGMARDDNHEHEPWPCPCPWFGYVGDYMYMYSDNVPAPGHDHFKHIDTREYVTVPHSEYQVWKISMSMATTKQRRRV
jgi:hypothetical protein